MKMFIIDLLYKKYFNDLHLRLIKSNDINFKQQFSIQ